MWKSLKFPPICMLCTMEYLKICPFCANCWINLLKLGNFWYNSILSVQIIAKSYQIFVIFSYFSPLATQNFLFGQFYCGMSPEVQLFHPIVQEDNPCIKVILPNYAIMHCNSISYSNIHPKRSFQFNRPNIYQIWWTLELVRNLITLGIVLRTVQL